VLGGPPLAVATVKIFLATSGRSGTGFLAAAFTKFTSLEVHHEEAPVLKHDLLRRANSVPYPKCSDLVNKAKSIAGRGPYVDTAHQFMKGFAPYALAEMPQLKVVHLVRNPLEVMRSRLLRGSVPGKTGWVQSLGLPNQLLPIPAKGLTDLQLIAWDWLEHEERFHRMCTQFSEVHELRFRDLTGTPAGTLRDLFTALGLRHSVEERQIPQLHRNANPRPTQVLPGDLEKFQDVCTLVRTAGFSDLQWLETAPYSY